MKVVEPTAKPESEVPKESDAAVKEARLQALREAREKEALLNHVRRWNRRDLKKERGRLMKSVVSLTRRDIRRLLWLGVFRRKVDTEFDYYAERFAQDAELLRVESRLAFLEAKNLGIDLRGEEHPDWWLDGESDELSETGLGAVSRMIREERRRTAEWWIKVVTPVLALLVSLFGLLVAAVSLAVRGCG
jgi:hypothetical protein